MLGCCQLLTEVINYGEEEVGILGEPQSFSEQDCEVLCQEEQAPDRELRAGRSAKVCLGWAIQLG